jgi:hypothetical protein
VRPVYNLQVAEVPEYFANGVLVHNCTRYVLNELPDPLPGPEERIYSPVAEHWRRELEQVEAERGYVG